METFYKLLHEFINWMQSKTITTHTVGASFITFASIYVADEEVRNFFIKLFHSHPNWPVMLLTFCGIILKYSRSTSTASLAYAAEKKGEEVDNTKTE